jgi:Large polyvalent protein associated domain 23
MPGLTLNSNPSVEDRYLAQRRMRGLSDTVFGLPDLLNTTINAGIRDVGSLTGLYDPNTAYQLPMASQSAANLGTQLTGAHIVPESGVSKEVAQKGANQQALMGMIPAGGVEDVATMPKYLGILAGGLAKKAPLLELPSAKNLLRHGDDPNKVWEATGWDYDPVGQWTWEIPDLKAKFTDPSKISADPNNPSRLGDVFEHPELYENYPSLADINIHRLTDPNSMNMGTFDPYTGNIGVRFDPIGHPEFDADIDPKGNTLHELQHAVQKLEGFEGGGNAGMVRGTILQPGSFAGEMMQRVMPVYMQHYGLDYRDPNDIGHFIGTQAFHDMADDISSEGYSRLMGESQAENVVFRSKLKPETLEKYSPTGTLGGKVPGGGSRMEDEILTKDELLSNRNWDPADYNQMMTDLRGPALGPAEERRRRVGLTLTSTP